MGNLPDDIMDKIIYMTMTQTSSVLDIVHTQKVALACKMLNKFYNKNNRKYKASIYLYELSVQLVNLTRHNFLESFDITMISMHKILQLLDIIAFCIETIKKKDIILSKQAIDDTLAIFKKVRNNVECLYNDIFRVFADYHGTPKIYFFIIMFIRLYKSKEIKRALECYDRVLPLNCLHHTSNVRRKFN